MFLLLLYVASEIMMSFFLISLYDILLHKQQLYTTGFMQPSMKFSDPPQSPGAMIAFLHRQNLGYMTKHLEKYGIGGGQFGFLMALYHQDGLHQEDLARMFLVNRATAARAVQKLESEGYVQRVQDPLDKRALRVNLTEDGKNLQEVVMKFSAMRREELFAGFSDEEQRIFMRLLSKMIDNVCEEKWDESTK